MSVLNSIFGPRCKMISEMERLATELSEDRDRLRKRLLDAKTVMDKAIIGAFSQNIFDFHNKRLVSNDGRCALQWQTRRHPDQPEGPDNQQTNSGIVRFVCL